jgi:hypothetical protein
MVAELGRAARRTVAREVWALWAGAGATYGPDRKAWFHTDHANVSTGALSSTTLKAAVLQLLQQTQPGNGERLGLPLRRGSL